MSASETELLLPQENEEGHQADLSRHSQGVPMNTEIAQLPPPPTNPVSVPGFQAQLPPAQNAQQIQLSSSPGQAYFTPDGRICYQQPSFGSQPVPSSQPGAIATQGQPPGQMVFIPTTQPGNPQVFPANQQQLKAATAGPQAQFANQQQMMAASAGPQVWPANQQQMMSAATGPQVWPANQQQMMAAGAGPQVWPVNQQQMTTGTTMQVPYSATQPPPYTPVVTAAGVDLRPSSYTIMSLIVTFICFILNITTLIFGIPAIILSITSEENKKRGDYATAKNYGKIALGINIANIIYTAVAALAITSGVLGALISNYYYYFS